MVGRLKFLCGVQIKYSVKGSYAKSYDYKWRIVCFMQEISIDFIKKKLIIENEFVKRMEDVRAEILEFGYYKSCHNELERIYWELMSRPQYVQYPNRIVAVQESPAYFYRGEPKIYSSSKPSFTRNLPVDVDDKMVYSFVESMRLSDLSLFFNKLYAVNCWGKSEFYFSAIAQHYEFKTTLMDITSKLRIALFFACCTSDENLKCRPLNEKDFICRESVDGRYGVIYIRERAGSNTNIIQPIGYQPLMRCHMQYGYVIPMNLKWDLRDSESGFTAYCFRHNEKFCEEIFELLDCGEKIYPSQCTDSIFVPFLNRLKQTKMFSKEAFKVIYEHRNDIPYSFPPRYSEQNILDILYERGIIIENSAVTEAEIETINRQWCSTCNNKECINKNN